MKLRRWFLPHQYLFGACVWMLLAFPASAQHKIVTKDGKTSNVQVVGVSGTNLQVKVGTGTIGIPFASIQSVEMPPPADYEAALKAFSARNYAKALPEAKAVVDKYRGLPVEWATQASAMLGDIYVELGKYEEAESAYKSFGQAYPGKGSIQSDVGRARIALAKKDLEAAKKALEPIAADALKMKNPSEGPALAFSQTFYLLGQIKEAEGDFAGALENYARTATLFYQDQAAVAAAQTRADALRKEHKDLVVP